MPWDLTNKVNGCCGLMNYIVITLFSIISYEYLREHLQLEKIKHGNKYRSRYNLKSVKLRTGKQIGLNQ